LKNLRQKAADRNEDEFYFGMMSRKGPGARVKEGRSYTGTVQGDRGNKALDMETVRLLKTQDMGYVRSMRQIASKQVAKLEQQIILTRGVDHQEEDYDDEDDDFDLPGEPQKPRKILFADSTEERNDELQKRIEMAAAADDSNDEAEFRGFDDDGGRGEKDAERKKSLDRLQRDLGIARKKLKVLTDAERELDIQRAKMAKTATSGGETRRGKKIRVRERKR
jgi:U3 small nucleolar RNA-associated protein 11